MRDKYNLNTLPAGIAGLEDVDMGKLLIRIISLYPIINVINEYHR